MSKFMKSSQLDSTYMFYIPFIFIFDNLWIEHLFLFYLKIF